MAEAMSDARLAEIEARANRGCRCDDHDCVTEFVQLVDEDVPALVAEVKRLRAERDWQPGRWRQVRRPDGSLWMETSDGDEAEAEARKQGWPLYRLWECRETEWRPATDAAEQQPEDGDRG